MPAKKHEGRGGSRVGAGRKPKPAHERHVLAVTVNLTEAEHNELRSAAAREPLGAYVRRLILRHLVRRRK
jgi:hypothetical protein